MNLKKLRFGIVSALLVAGCYVLALSYLGSSTGFGPRLFIEHIVFIGLISVSSSLFVQYLDGGDKTLKIMFLTGITPFALVLGSFMLFVYFPNLSTLLMIAAGVFNFLLLYTLLLLNNVMLVVESREVAIPVYRVAVNWVQIVLLSISLVLFTGVYKTSFQPLVQVMFIALASYIFYQYLIWVYSKDKDVRLLQSYGSVVLCLAVTTLVGWAASMVLFFSAESFLRGIFVASVFLLGLGYIQLYLKNALSTKSIRDYVVICLIFLAALVVFKP